MIGDTLKGAGKHVAVLDGTFSMLLVNSKVNTMPNSSLA
jgi:hypothetical protein